MATAEELVKQQQETDAKARKAAYEAKKKADKSKLDALREYGQTELVRKQQEWIKTRDALIKDIANNGGVKNPQNATALDQLNKVLKDLGGIDQTIARLKKDTAKNQNRPVGVPADATFNSVTGTWTSGKRTFDKTGKETTPAATTTDYETKDGVLYFKGKAFNGEYQGKTYKEGKVSTTPPKTDAGPKGPTTATGPTGPTAGTGATTATTATGATTDINKVFELAQKYGDIDEIFKTNTQLRDLLTKAIGKINDPNDDYTVDRFVSELKGTSWWGENAGIVKQRVFLKNQYNNALAKLDKNAPDYEAKVAALRDTNEYGRGLQDLENRIQAFALTELGRKLDAKELDGISSGLYDLGFEKNDIRINSKINELINTSGAIQGTVGQNLQLLREAARQNGLDLEKDFAGLSTGWLRQIAEGKSINDFYQIIRDKAAQTQNGYVRDLMRTGYNLRDIYGTYIGLMADAFNIDQNTISLSDELLKGVFNDKGGITFNDFLTKVRQDKRFAGTPGEAGVKDFRQAVADRAKALGVTLDDAAIDDVVNNSMALGLGAGSSMVDKLIRAKFRYVPGGITGGAAGLGLAALRQTAAANGIDLDKQFGGELQTWLNNLLQGESVETYKNIIRQTAKLGLPERVGALLDQGVDLDTIYSPYKNMMAAVLEVNPETIGLDDPTLRAAINQEGEMSLYDYQKYLRKDSRWQYTNNARESVSSSVLQVLRDFGFQGQIMAEYTLPAGFTAATEMPSQYVKYFGATPAGMTGYKVTAYPGPGGETVYRLSVAKSDNTYGEYGAAFTESDGVVNIAGGYNAAYVSNQKVREVSTAASKAATGAGGDKRAAGESAYALLYDEFSRYGLAALVEPLKQFIVDGLSPAEFVLKLRETDAYKKRFAANQTRIQKGLRALSEAEYITLEDQYQEIMRRYGLPESYYARGDMGIQSGFEKFIGLDVSPVELEDRVQTAYNRVINANPEVSIALRNFYPGITNGDILAYALDPNEALDKIKRKVTAAEIGGAAVQSGLTTNESDAEYLARYGITKEQAQQGYRTISGYLPRAQQLSSIYEKQIPGAYTQASAEREVFNVPGAAEEERKRLKLTALEQAAFSGSSGLTGGALGRERAGQY